jgi:hypothetical protein
VAVGVCDRGGGAAHKGWGGEVKPPGRTGPHTAPRRPSPVQFQDTIHDASIVCLQNKCFWLGQASGSMVEGHHTPGSRWRGSGRTLTQRLAAAQARTCGRAGGRSRGRAPHHQAHPWLARTVEACGAAPDRQRPLWTSSSPVLFTGAAALRRNRRVSKAQRRFCTQWWGLR